MERKIGEIFEYDGEWYQCLKEKTCTCFGCDFRGYKCDDISLQKVKGSCQSECRKDNKSVIFKKLEKVGEPFKSSDFDDRIVMLQSYKMLTIPYISGVVCYIHYDTNIIDIEIKQTKEDMEEYRMYDAKEDIPEFDKVVDECLFGEDKIDLKPFDLEAAKAGKPVCTRDGRKARIICFDAKGSFPIIALVDEKGEEFAFSYTAGGKYSAEISISNKDLMMLPEKKEGWVNVYKDSVYNTKEEALAGRSKCRGYIDTIKISWEE